MRQNWESSLKSSNFVGVTLLTQRNYFSRFKSTSHVTSCMLTTEQVSVASRNWCDCNPIPPEPPSSLLMQSSYGSQSYAQRCSNYRARATIQCDSFRTPEISQGVLWLTQSCCVTSQSCFTTSQGCSVMSQDCCKTYSVITPTVSVGGVRLSHRAHACRTAPSPASVLGVISQLSKIL